MKAKLPIPFLFFTLFLVSCSTMKQQALFDAPADQEIPEGIENFYALNIFDGKMNGEHWFSKPPEISTKKCLDITNTYFISPELIASNDVEAKPSMRWKWDKKAGDCSWMGMGFGWDGWAGKDMSQIIDKAAIQFKVRSAKGSLKSLPLAACFEDYADNQVWIGFHPQVIENGIITDDQWSNVTLPLAEFEWENAQDIDMTNIKQMIVQFEAAGDIYVDEIKVIPFKGGFTKRIEVPLAERFTINLDGIANEKSWGHAKEVEFSSFKVKSLADSDNLYFLLSFTSKTSMKNKNKDGSVWNGDAFEIAFSTNYELSRKRSFMQTTDRHIGINLEDYSVWDWREQKAVKNVTVSQQKNEDNYQFEIKIPLKSLELESFKSDVNYNIEFAVNQSSDDGSKREIQYRWNSPSKEGFHVKPSLWGDLTFIKIK